MTSDGYTGEAVRDTSQGVVVEFMVTPNASNPGIKGFNTWRKRIEVRVAAEAKKSKANAEIVKLVADALGVDTGRVEVIRGEKSHEKSVLIRAIHREDVIRKLTRVMRGGE